MCKSRQFSDKKSTCDECGILKNIKNTGKKSKNRRKFRLLCRDCENIESICYRFKLKISEYKQMFMDRNNKCDICNNEAKLIRKNGKSLLSIDHNHITKKIRGLLCNECNIGLGKFKTDNGTDLLEKAIKYIRKDIYGK